MGRPRSGLPGLFSGDSPGRQDIRGTRGDIEFVAEARTDVPALCAQNERLIAALEVALKCSWCEGREDDCTACDYEAVEALLNPKGGGE